MNWIQGEKGPTCFCGLPTGIVITGDHVDLLCIFHNKEAGLMFPLPKNGRPDKWPEMSDEEMVELVNRGEEEQFAMDEE